MAARGAIFSRASASARSIRSCRIRAPVLAGHGRLLRRGALPRGLLAAAGANLVQLDEIAVRVVHEDLLELGADHGLDAPVLDAETVQLPLGLPPPRHPQRPLCLRPL